MWKDSTAFIQFQPMHNYYVTLANNFKIPITGQGIIHLKINGYVIQLHEAFHVPTLQYSLYSVKQHRRYLQCSCLFDNTSAKLTFPKFSFDIDDEFDMIVNGRSAPNSHKFTGPHLTVKLTLYTNQQSLNLILYPCLAIKPTQINKFNVESLI